MDKTISDILLSALFAAIGFILLYVGYRVFDLLTPTDLGHEIFEEHNVAAGVFTGAFVLGLAIIIHAAIS